MVSSQNASQAIKDSLNVPGNAPFDPELHVIFGKKKLADGSLLRHERIVTKKFYKETVLKYEGGVGEGNGYLNFNDLGKLHNLVDRGEFQKGWLTRLLRHRRPYG